MGEVKELNIKNRTYYYFDDMIDIRNFHFHIEVLIFVIFVTIRLRSLVIVIVIVIMKIFVAWIWIPIYFKEKYDEKYLILDSAEKYEEVFSRIKSEIEIINGGKELFYKRNYARIGVNTGDDVTVIIRYVFQNVKNWIH